MNALVEKINNISPGIAIKELSSKNCITNLDIPEFYKLTPGLDRNNDMDKREAILKKVSDDTQLADDKYKYFSFSREEIYDDRF